MNRNAEQADLCKPNKHFRRTKNREVFSRYSQAETRTEVEVNLSYRSEIWAQKCYAV